MMTPQQIEAQLAQMDEKSQDAFLSQLPMPELEAYSKFSMGANPPGRNIETTQAGSATVIRTRPMEEATDAELEKIQNGEDPEKVLNNIPQELAKGDGGRSFLDTGFGLAGRNLMRGAGAIPGLIFDQVSDSPGATDRAINHIADAMGMRDARAGEEGYPDRMVGAGFQGLGGAAAMGAGGMTAPGLEAASGATGSMAGQHTAEMGGSPGEQLVASIMGGALPGLARSGAAMGVRGAMRGNDPGPMREALRTFDAAGTFPSVAQATGGETANAVEAQLSQMAGIPFMKSPSSVIRGSNAAKEASIGDLLEAKANSLNQVSSDVGPMQNLGSNEAVGTKIGQDAEEVWAPAQKTNIEDLHNKFYETFPAKTLIPVTKTMNTLEDLVSIIPGADKISKNTTITPARGQWLQVLADLKADIKANLAKNGSEGIPIGAVKSIRSRLGALMADSAFETSVPNAELKRLYGALTGDMKEAAQIASNVPAIGQNQINALNSAVEKLGPIREQIQTVERAKELVRKNPTLSDEVRANFLMQHNEELKKLQLELNKQELRASGQSRPITDAIAETGQKVSYENALKAIETQKKSPQSPIEAFNAANKATSEYHDTLDLLRPVLDRSGGSEKVFKAALGGMRDGGTVLRKVYEVLTPEGRDLMTAAIMKRAAKTAAGDPEDFDMIKWAGNYKNMDNEAKKVVFGNLGPKYQQDLDAIAKTVNTIAKQRAEYGVATSAKEGKFGGQMILGSLLLAPTSIGAGLSTGNAGLGLILPATIGTYLGGAKMLSKWMTNPKTVRLLAESTKLPKEQLPIFINSVAQQATRDADPDLKELAEYLKAQEESDNAL